MAAFDIGRPDNRVEYDVWYSSSSTRMLDFLTDFAPLDAEFGDSVLMTPHFKFQECFECQKDFIERNCFGNGKYCAFDTNHPTINGRDLILEDLRQLCIYNFDYNSTKTRSMWWDYIIKVHEECYGSVTKECSELAHKDLGISFMRT